jgi:hypothetical protein
MNVTTVGGGVPAAATDAYTSALLHLDGSEAGTVFTDETGKTWTRSSTGSFTTQSDKKFGTACLYNHPDQGYISTPNHADFFVGSNNFTVDLWFYKYGHSGTLFALVDSSGIYPLLVKLEGGKLRLQLTISGDSNWSSSTLSSSAFTQNAWHHLALVRDGNNFNAYDNGSLFHSVALEGTLKDHDGIQRVGGMSDYFTYIDEFHFVNGQALWIENFTPPASPY